MRQLPTSMRLTILAAAAVALAWALSVGGTNQGKGGEPSTAPVASCSTDDSTGCHPSAVRQREPSSSREALRQGPPVARGLNIRVSKSGVLVVPNGGPPEIRLSAWLGHAA